MSFGKKGVTSGAPEGIQPATRAQFGGNRPAEPVDPMAAKREAFIQAERQRNGTVERSAPQEVGLSDYARDYGSSSSTIGAANERIFGKPAKRSLLTAYILWFIIGQSSAHRFYLGASQSAIIQLSLLLGSVVVLFIFAPLGVIGFCAWLLWLLADVFLMPGLHRKLKAQAYDPSPIFS